MLEKPIERLILFGTALRYLQDANAGWGLRNLTSGMRILGNIDVFLEHLKELRMVVTLRAAADLITLNRELLESKDEAISEQQAKTLRDVMSKLRPTLEAEAGGMIAYIISESRIPVEKLIDAPASLFASNVFERLPEIAKRDFAEATKCIAFERATAAAFHMLRATEATLKYYYCSKVKRKRSSLMWGPMIHSMNGMPKRFPKALLSQLDHIREGFRNPTAHPEKSFDTDEAHDLLSICIDAANRMVRDMR